MILCITGPMAAGKNAASDILRNKGFACVDADLLGHEAIENKKNEILSTFGVLAKQKKIDLLTSEGKINRRNLGALIFNDDNLIKKQENIVFPEICCLFDKFIEENLQKNIVINATVLYKVPLIKKIDLILYVDAPILLRLYRAKKRDNISYKFILQRFKAQRHLFAKYKKCNADIIRVWNTGTKQNLEKQINKKLFKCRQGI